METPTIYLDTRDGSGDLVGYLTPKKSVELAVLNSGDIMGIGNGPKGRIVWGIEIKKLGDMLQSLQDGRLVEQLGKMFEDYDWKFLLLEADIRMHHKTGHLQQRKFRKKGATGWVEYWEDALHGNRQIMMYSHFQSWMMSVALCAGVQLLPRTTSREETAAMIMGMNALLSKEWDAHSVLKVFNDSSQPTLFQPSTTMCVIRNLAEGMGWEKSAAAAHYFKTPKAAINASAEEWMKVDGVGKVLAKRLVEAASTPHVMRKRIRRVN